MVKVPLRVLITDPKVAELPEMAERIDMLRKQGHEINVSNGQLLEYDFVCGPNCWFLNPNAMNLFVLAINNARKVANADQERTEQEAAKRRAKRPAKKRTGVAGRKPAAKGKAKPVRGSGAASETPNATADGSNSEGGS